MKSSQLKSLKDDKTERVLVYLRIRPFTEDELKTDNTTPIEKIDKNSNSLISKNHQKININI